MAFVKKADTGIATLYQDGKRIVPFAYHLAKTPTDHACPKKCIPQFASAGINVVGVPYFLHEDWTENGFDGSVLLGKIRDIKKANPNAKLLVRCILTPPYWWMRKYPEELIKYYGVESVDTEHIPVVGNKDKTNEIRASFVSEKWQTDVCEQFKGMHRVLVESGFSEDIFAIQPAYGTCGEWHIFGNYYGNNLFEGDYSLPMLTYFRAYLKGKYKTDEALRKAWGNPKVTLKTARLATPKQRKQYAKVGEYLYRLPEKHQRALDSLKCLQTGAPDAILRFAKCLKETWNNQILVGSFYGYHFACGDVYGRMIEPQALLESEYVDYLAAPCAYTANKWGGNTAFLRYLPESLRINGKLFLCEVDQGYKSYSCYRDVANDKKYVCENNEEYNAITARNVFENVLRGMGAWFFDHQHPEDYARIDLKTGYWDDPERMAVIEKMRVATEEIYKRRPRFASSADVLFVYDTQSVYHFGPSLTGDLSDIHNTYNHFDMADAIGKAGVGYDTLYLHDLQKCDLAQYKCVVFVACEAMSKSEFDYVKNRVMSGGRTVVFMRRNGWIVDEKTDDKHVADLYGFTPSTEKKQEKIGEKCRVVSYPNFVYDKDEYRRLFERAGAHIYTDGGELVCAQNQFVMVHTKGTSQTVLHLACGDVLVENGACNTVVYDNLTGERVY